MAGHISETKGIVLFARNHREKDKLVKIFTEKYGKLMFFVKNVTRANHPLAPAILPFTEAEYVGDIRADGLSFLNTVKTVHPYTKIQEDIFISAYATYILNLVDAAIEDGTYDPFLFDFTNQALIKLNEGKDPEIITNIFEIQIMSRFGISLNWHECAICQETKGKFDFSTVYHGILCEKHFSADPRRFHADPRAIHFMRLFAEISYDQVHSINVKAATKKEIRRVIDLLYEEYVGIHLKSKKFIDEMRTWEEALKLPPKKKEE